MLRLPQLSWMPAGFRPCVSAVGCAELAQYLARPTRARGIRLLQQNPGVCLWGVLLAYQRDRLELRDTVETWGWLEPHLSEWLLTPLELLESIPERQRWERELTGARRRAEMTWHAFGTSAPAAAHLAYLRELLRRGWAWLGFRPADRRWQDIPPWLRELWQADLSEPEVVPIETRPIETNMTHVVEAGDDRELARRSSEIVLALAESHAIRMPHRELLEQRKRGAVREFAYGAGHELNNPLAIISARAQSLLSFSPSPDQQRELANILVQVQRAHEMLADLMLYAKPPAPQWEAVVVSELVAAVVQSFRARAASRHIVVEQVLEETGPRRADPQQLEALIGAALKNAELAVNDGGWIGITLEKCVAPEWTRASDRSWFRLAVEDNGKGLDPRAMEHCFDPFFCGREAGRGLGFGLCKVLQIATLHQGEVRMESSPRGGCRLVVELPLERTGKGVLP